MRWKSDYEWRACKDLEGHDQSPFEGTILVLNENQKLLPAGKQ